MNEYFSDLAGTIPAKPGDPVACMKAGPLVYEQPTVGMRPVLRQAPSDEPLVWDHVDDALLTAAGGTFPIGVKGLDRG